MKYRVEFHHWISGSGWNYSTTMDNLDEFMTAEEYVKALDDGDIAPENSNEAFMVEIYDENEELLSQYWCQKDEEE